MQTVANLFFCMLTVCRIAVGVTIIYAGAELVRGEGLLATSEYGSVWTGLFIIAIGVSCIFSSLFSRSCEDKTSDQQLE